MSLYRRDALDCLDRAYGLENEKAAERQCVLTEAVVYALFDLTDAIRAGHGPREQMNEAQAELDAHCEKMAKDLGSSDPFSEALERVARITNRIFP